MADVTYILMSHVTDPIVKLLFRSLREEIRLERKLARCRFGLFTAEMPYQVSILRTRWATGVSPSTPRPSAKSMNSRTCSR